jgi:hypothetical protein
MKIQLGLFFMSSALLLSTGKNICADDAAIPANGKISVTTICVGNATIPENFTEFISINLDDLTLDDAVIELQKRKISIKYVATPEAVTVPKVISLKAERIRPIDILAIISMTCNVDIEIQENKGVVITDRKEPPLKLRTGKKN